ncbi:GEVED domain-containing protein [Bizionia myxarmorum]|uniref:T9SS type A sorting domain-containing protein n=1 Tax=Bizionia myxarmorum TaxID=291186 RepID=A0A5D0RAG7_9FLAO|nr:GEVED domain-containing protein [Bizionia myxarmorum]TYB78512.1 T9SS type A sorting domain-containing protein [Bizionia myxarmorum]
MKKITMLFIATLGATLFWTSSIAQTQSCSQETLATAVAENGYGNLKTLIFANDLALSGVDSFTLNSVQLNVMVNTGVTLDGVTLRFYEDSASGNGPGAEIGSTPLLAPTTINNLGLVFGSFDRLEVDVDLITPFTFTGNGSASVFWVGVTVNHVGADAFMEITTDTNTPNEIYYLNGTTWVGSSDPIDGYDEVSDGIISFFGDCIASSDCSGMPNAGVTIVNPATGNAGSNYTVTAQGISGAPGISFQWQSNTNGAGWIDEGTASNSYMAYTATAPAQIGDEVSWRLISTCVSTGDVATSDIATFTVAITYCDVQFPSAVEPITYVNFADIDNTTSAAVGGSPALENFTSQIASVDQGSSYPIEIKGNTDGSFTSKIMVYVDWNQDGVFDNAVGSNEMYALPDIYGSTGEDAISSTGSIAVPTSAMLGNTTMRVMKRFSTAAAPCNVSGYGQAEDYTVEVVDPAMSVDDNFKLSGTRLYPNPINDGAFYIHAPTLNGEQVEVNITDMAGRQVFNNKLSVNNSKVTVSVNNALTSGLYLVTLKHAGQQHTFRVVKN